jgi:predicted metalloendopeptidase
MAQLNCSRLTPEEATRALAWETHAPPKARVNVTLSNFDGFARAFQCEPGAPMAPRDRCVLW